MKTNKIIALFAAAIALIACDPTPAPVFEPALSVDNTETISVPAAGADTVVNVSANVSWTAVADQDFVTITPASVQITDKTSHTTPVSISVAENEGDARTANVTITAEGCEPVVIVIEQGEVVVPPVFEVLDNTGEQPAAATIDVPFDGATNIVYVNSNINWTAISSETWLTVNPTSYTAETKVAEPVAVTITAAANAGAARTATVTFAAAGQQDVVITVNQGVAPTLNISISDITYQSAVATFTPSDDALYYIEQYITKANYGTYSTDEEFATATLNYFYRTYGTTYSQYGFTSYSELFFEGLAVKGTDVMSMTELKPETEYVVVGFFVNENMEVASSVTKAEFTTKAKPGPDPDYTALLGTYTFNAYSYFDKMNVSGTLVVEEGTVNETYLISIPGIDWCPEQGQYIDHFECPWDKEGKKSFSIINGEKGDMGIGWNYGSLGSCGIQMDMFYYNADDDITALVLTADQSGNLSATSPAIPAGDYICLQSGIYNASGDTGAANGILIFISGMNFTKSVAPTVKTVNNTGFFAPKMNNKIFKAHKAEIAR